MGVPFLSFDALTVCLSCRCLTPFACACTARHSVRAPVPPSLQLHPGVPVPVHLQRARRAPAPQRVQPRVTPRVPGPGVRGGGPQRHRPRPRLHHLHPGQCGAGGAGAVPVPVAHGWWGRAGTCGWGQGRGRCRGQRVWWCQEGAWGWTGGGAGGRVCGQLLAGAWILSQVCFFNEIVPVCLSSFFIDIIP